MTAESFRKSEQYCREQAETSVVPEKWLQKAKEWAALAEKLEQRDLPVSQSDNQDGDSDGHNERTGTTG
jgi:hypothetical protein